VGNAFNWHNIMFVFLSERAAKLLKRNWKRLHKVYDPQKMLNMQEDPLRITIDALDSELIKGEDLLSKDAKVRVFLKFRRVEEKEVTEKKDERIPIRFYAVKVCKPEDKSSAEKLLTGKSFLKI